MLLILFLWLIAACCLLHTRLLLWSAGARLLVGVTAETVAGPPAHQNNTHTHTEIALALSDIRCFCCLSSFTFVLCSFAPTSCLLVVAVLLLLLISALSRALSHTCSRRVALCACCYRRPSLSVAHPFIDHLGLCHRYQGVHLCISYSFYHPLSCACTNALYGTGSLHWESIHRSCRCSKQKLLYLITFLLRLPTVCELWTQRWALSVVEFFKCLRFEFAAVAVVGRCSNLNTYVHTYICMQVKCEENQFDSLFCFGLYFYRFCWCCC